MSSVKRAVKYVSSDYTIQPENDVILVDVSSNDVTVTMPSSPDKGDEYTVKDATGSQGTHTLFLYSPDGIDGNTSTTTVPLMNPWGAATIMWSGSTWLVTSKYTTVG